MRKRRRRRRSGRGRWWLAGMLLCCAAGSGPVLRWLLVPTGLASCLMVPVLTYGATTRQLLTPRARRIRQRQQYWDPRQGKMVRPPRPAIPKRLRRMIWIADRGRCMAGRRHPAPFHIDHRRPWAAGGLTTAINCGLLCARCNLVKSNYSRDRDGYVHYRGWTGLADKSEAGRIYRRQLAAAHNPLRWARMGLAWWATR